MARKGGKKDSGKTTRPVAAPKREPAWYEALERRGFWIAAMALAILLVAFFNPVFFGGKEFRDADNVASLAFRPFVEEAFESSGSILDRYPLWTPYIFSGMPSWLIAAPYTSLRSIVMAPIPGVFKVIAYYFGLGLFTWLFLRRNGIGVLPALMGSVAYVFSTHIVTLVMFGHNSKIATLMFMPLVLLATEEVWRRVSLRWVSLLALAIGLMIGSTHFQVAYYTLLAAGLYLLVVTVDAFRLKEGVLRVVKPWLAWIASLVVGIAAAAVVFLPAREYAEHSIRGGTGGGLAYDYATNWSLHPLEMATFFSPSFMGYGLNTYWGWMPFTHFPHYMGILVLFLAVVAVVLWPRNRFHIYLALLALLSLLLAFGKHVPIFYNLMFEFFPHFSKFRVPSMILLLTQFAVAVLAASGLHRLLTVPAEERADARRKVMMVGGVFLGLVILLGGIVGSGSLDGTIQQRMAERAAGMGLSGQQITQFASQYAPGVADMVTQDTVILGMLLATGLVLIWARFRGKVPAAWVAVGILILVVVDLFNIDRRPATYHERTPIADSFPSTPAVQFLQNDPEPFRILPLTGRGPQNNSFAYHKISSILGYHPAKLQIYQDLIDDQGPVGIMRTLSRGNFNVVSMLNMKYILADQEYAAGPLVTAFRGSQFVMENREYLPRMWFVDRARVVSDPDAHLRAVADTSWNPRIEALVFEDPGPLEPGSGGTAVVTLHEAREIRATVTSPGNSFLVISEVYYQPGWNATLNGEPVDIHRVNYVLDGIVVPAGSHELVLRFDPPVFRRSINISLAAHGLIGVGLLLSFVLGRRRTPEEG